MREPKVISYPEVKVIMRKDFYDEFNDNLKKIIDDTGATYFGHNIIKNYREPGHQISTFCNFEAWHDIYWENYRNDDPMEIVLHQTAKKNSFGAISWEIGLNSSSCSKERIKFTKVKDGVFFSFKKPENYMESFTIGWNNLNANEMDAEYIFYLCSLLKPLRDHHWVVHNKI